MLTFLFGGLTSGIRNKFDPVLNLFNYLLIYNTIYSTTQNPIQYDIQLPEYPIPAALLLFVTKNTDVFFRLVFFRFSGISNFFFRLFFFKFFLLDFGFFQWF